MTLKKALSLIDQSLEAYRALLRDDPQDFREAADRQQAAADLLDEARNVGMPLKGDDFKTFSDRITAAVGEIENLEARRISGDETDEYDDGEEDPEPPDESENDDDRAEMYSSMAEPEEELAPVEE